MAISIDLMVQTVNMAKSLGHDVKIGPRSMFRLRSDGKWVHQTNIETDDVVIEWDGRPFTAKDFEGLDQPMQIIARLANMDPPAEAPAEPVAPKTTKKKVSKRRALRTTKKEEEQETPPSSTSSPPEESAPSPDLFDET